MSRHDYTIVIYFVEFCTYIIAHFTNNARQVHESYSRWRLIWSPVNGIMSMDVTREIWVTIKWRGSSGISKCYGHIFKSFCKGSDSRQCTRSLRAASFTMYAYGKK